MKKPRGTRDLYGDELARVRMVQSGLSEVFERYGYDEIETPIFEDLDLFTRKSGSEVVDQIYHFEDKSGRDLALRPELTAPSIRFYNNRLKSEPKPLKIFYSGHCFRYERPQAGRWRQFLQAGVELIGSDRPEADAEVIALTDDAMGELGLKDYSLRLGHIGLLRLLLESGGVPKDSQDPILRAIDSEDGERLEDELDDSDLDVESRELLLELIDLRGGFGVVEEAGELLDLGSEVEGVIGNFENILKKLDSMGLEDYEVDWGIARGLEYYTGIVFEVYSDEVQLGGGGRYDGLIEALGGDPTPAVGVGLGVDRIAEALEKEGVDFEGGGLDAMLMPTEDSMLNESLEIARKMRSEGLRTDVDLMGRSLSKAFSYADSRGARYAIIVGPEDVSEGEVTIRDMRTGDQEKVSIGEVSAKLKS